MNILETKTHLSLARKDYRACLDYSRQLYDMAEPNDDLTIMCLRC